MPNIDASAQLKAKWLTRYWYWLFWLSTSLLIALMLIAGIYDSIGHKSVLRYAAHLGYPAYFIQWSGVCKLLGVFVFITGWPSARFREWVYAGFCFDMSSGLVSHFMCNDPWQITALPGLGLMVCLVSYISFQRTYA